MKKVILILAAITAITLFGLRAKGQDAPPPLPGNDSGFLSTVTGYFSGFNSDLATTWTNHSGQFWSGAEFKQGAHAGTTLGLSYNVWKDFSAEAVFHLRDISGDVGGYAGGIGYSRNIVDLKVTGFIDVGYDTDKARIYVEPGVRFQKALTQHTYAFVSISAVVERNAVPKVGIGGGFVF